MKDIIRVAVDGPSGAGKSTIARAVAERMSLDYIDTGAMYRAVGYKMLRQGVALSDEAAIRRLMDTTEIDFCQGDTILDGEVISDRIRTPEISKQASDCSALAMVRRRLVELQRKMGSQKSVIMDGRDIGTVVFPDAEYKFFITATPEERARRRYKELAEKGSQLTFDQVLSDINQRDYNDTHREVDPLRRAEDAVEIDTTHMTIEDVIEFICKEMEK